MTQTFMAVEIAEAGAVVRRQLAANAALTAKVAADLRALKPAFVATVARGSSDHAALYLKHLVELKLALACASLGPSIASLYHAPLKLEGAVAIAISQSGRSPDILAMQRAAKAQRALSIAFVNDVDSPLAREADALLPLCAGLERSVAATKSMIAALVAGASLVGPLERRFRTSGGADEAAFDPRRIVGRTARDGGDRDAGPSLVPVRRRAGRHARRRRRGGAQAQGNVGDPR